MMPQGWRLLRADAGVVISHRGSLVCVHYTGSRTEADVVGDFAAQQPVLEQYGELSQMVVFHSARIGRITAGARLQAAKNLRELGVRLRCSAIVLLGDGLAAALMRVAIATANLLSGAGDRHRIFTTVPDAIAWLERFPDQHPSVSGLDVDALVAAVSEQAPAGLPTV